MNRAVYELLAILKGGVASDYARSETQMRRKKGDLSGAIVSLQAERQKRQNKNTNKKESIKKAAGDFEPSRQDEGFNDVLFDPIFQGLAISLMGGTITSTFLTLIVVPLLYFKMLKGKKNKK